MQAKLVLVALIASCCRGLFSLIYPKRVIPTTWLVGVWGISSLAALYFLLPDLMSWPIFSLGFGVVLVSAVMTRNKITIFKAGEDEVTEAIEASFEQVGLSSIEDGNTWSSEKIDWSLNNKYNVSESQITWYGNLSSDSYQVWRKIFIDKIEKSNKGMVPVKSLVYLVGPIVILIIMYFRGWF